MGVFKKPWTLRNTIKSQNMFTELGVCNNASVIGDLFFGFYTAPSLIVATKNFHQGLFTFIHSIV